MCVTNNTKPNFAATSPALVLEAVGTTARTMIPQAALTVLAAALVLHQDTIEKTTATTVAEATPVLILSVVYPVTKGTSGRIVFKTPEAITIAEATVVVVVVLQAAVVVVVEVTAPTTPEATAIPTVTMAMAIIVLASITMWLSSLLHLPQHLLPDLKCVKEPFLKRLEAMMLTQSRLCNK